MNSTLPIALVAGLLGGAAGSLGAAVLLDGDEPERSRVEPLGVESATLESISSQLARMRGDYDELLTRLDDLETSAAMSAPAVGRTSADPTAADLSSADLEDKIAAVLDSMQPGEAAVVTPDFREQVETVLAMKEEEERLEREQERAEERARRIEDRLARMQTELGLDPTQVNGMREVMQNAEVRRDEMRQEMRTIRESGGDWGSMRELWTQHREEQEAAVRSILTPAQYQQYEESDMDRFGGFGRGGRRGDDDDRGRGGRRDDV